MERRIILCFNARLWTGRCDWIILFQLGRLKQDWQDPWLMSLLLGIFYAPRATVVACALGIAGRKATSSREVLTSKQCAHEWRCKQQPQPSWAHTNLVGRWHRLSGTVPAVVPALACESG